jgi:hypothetical protein
MSETLFYNPNTTISTDTIATGNISVNLDLLDQWLYLRPSVSNAATIVAGMSRFCNTYGRSIFGMNVFSTQTFSYANLYGTMTSGQIYGTAYMPGGYVFQADGNGPGVCAVFSSKENTVTNYAVSGTGGNGSTCGCLLPDGRALMVPINAAPANFWIWNNNTRTSSTFALTTGQRGSYGGACIMPDGNIALYGPTSNLMILNTSTFVLSNITSYAGKTFGNGCTLDPTGNVIITPGTSSGVGIWNPITGILTTVATPGSTDQQWSGAVAGDGRVVFGPWTQNYVGTYNPFNLSYTSYPVTFLGSGVRFGMSRTLPDGRVLFLPGFSANTGFSIFDHITNTVTNFTETAFTTGTLYGGNFVPDGRFICANTTGVSNVPIITGLSRGVPEAWCLHPFFNKAR